MKNEIEVSFERDCEILTTIFKSGEENSEVDFIFRRFLTELHKIVISDCPVSSSLINLYNVVVESNRSIHNFSCQSYLITLSLLFGHPKVPLERDKIGLPISSLWPSFLKNKQEISSKKSTI